MDDRHERLRVLFLAACELVPADRDAFVELVCGDDGALREELEGLLREDAESAPPPDSDPGEVLPEFLERRCGGDGRLFLSLHGDATAAERTQLEGADAEAESIQGAKTRYSKVGEIARGGMGVILEVWDEDLRRPLALKRTIESLDTATDEEHTEIEQVRVLRFLEEAQITGQLDHPGVVAVHQLGLDADKHLFFTMPLVRGRNLKEVFDLARRDEMGWTRTRALEAVVKVCETLAYAHSRGVIHRDVKPQNVMVGNFGETYVMDWGLAKVVGRDDLHDLRVRFPDDPRGEVGETRSEAPSTVRGSSPLMTLDGAAVGTPSYMSPEQAEGRVHELDQRADIYAAGAMLYELLAGRMPYVEPDTTTNPFEVLDAVTRGPPAPIFRIAPSVPQELVAICEKAMARSADDRYASCLDLADDLRAYLDHRVVRAYRTGAIAELKSWIARNRATATVAATAVVSLTIVLLVFLFVQRAKNAEITQQRNLADARLAEVLRLSDIRRLHQCREEARILWPCVPDRVASMEAWLTKAEELARGMDRHRESLAALRRRALGRSDSPTEAPADGRSWEFADDEDQWWHDTLSELVAELEVFTGDDPERGLSASVSRRLARARTIQQRSIADHREAWDEAIRSIADRAESPPYAGLRIATQIGLVPLGRDPHSGLWEFVHLETGTVPERSPDGKLQITAATGIVLVLLPGGTFRMGAAKPTSEQPEGGPNVDPFAYSNESPVHDVRLAPFFLSKYEMTQEQWSRWTGANPSSNPPDGQLIGELHPVENVSWKMAAETVGQIGLALPTEAQWEYGTRAGTATIWWTGDERESLRGRANLADQSAKRVGARWSDINDWPELDDGYALHAPVGTYRANPFGLHDVHGNVWEWCADWYGGYDLPVKGDSGERTEPPDEATKRVIRGGGFIYAARVARSALRRNGVPAFRSHDLGVRPARRLSR